MNADEIAMIVMLTLFVSGVGYMIKTSAEKTNEFYSSCIEKGGTPLILRSGNKCIKAELIK